MKGLCADEGSVGGMTAQTTMRQTDGKWKGRARERCRSSEKERREGRGWRMEAKEKENNGGWQRRIKRRENTRSEWGKSSCDKEKTKWKHNDCQRRRMLFRSFIKVEKHNVKVFCSWWYFSISLPVSTDPRKRPKPAVLSDRPARGP